MMMMILRKKLDQKKNLKFLCSSKIFCSTYFAIVLTSNVEYYLLDNTVNYNLKKFKKRKANMTQIQFMMTWWGLHSLGQKDFQNSAHNYFLF